MALQQEGSPKRKDFQRTTNDEIDAFLSSKEASKPAQASSGTPTQPAQKAAPPPKDSGPTAQPIEPDKAHEAELEQVRNSRAVLEAAHDVALLRKKAHAAGHKAAKFYHKYKSDEAKAQKLVSKAYSYREKATGCKEIADDLRGQEKALESELAGAASGSSGLSPESIRDKMANYERKAAKQQVVAQKYESKAAALTEKAARYRTRAAKFLEQNKIQEYEQKQYSKRADILEKAGT